MTWQNWAVNLGLRIQLKRLLKNRADLAAIRRRTAKPTFRIRPPAGWRIRPSDGAFGPGEWIEPAGAFDPARGRTLLYCHGGGYMFCTPQTYRPITVGLAKRLGARVLAPDYRLAPEHKYPAPLDDVIAAWRALRAQGTPASRIALGGDSAGGGLALGVLLRLRDAGEELPAAAFLFAPWTDLAATGASLRTNSRSDPSLVGESVGRGIGLYLGEVPRTDPIASPLYGDPRGLPPTYISASDIEVLFDDATRMAEKLRAAGVETELRVWHGVAHVWQNLAPFLPEANAGLDEAAAFIAGKMA